MSAGARSSSCSKARAPVRSSASGSLQQPPGVVVAEHQGLQREGELLGVEIGAEVALRDRGAGDRGDRTPASPAGGCTSASRIAPGWSSYSIGGGDEDATAVQGLGLPVAASGRTARGPAPPRAGPSASAGSPMSVNQRAGVLERLQLELLLGPEVGEQPALAHLGPVGELADGEPLEADLRGDRAAPRRGSTPWSPRPCSPNQNRTVVLFRQGFKPQGYLSRYGVSRSLVVPSPTCPCEL